MQYGDLCRSHEGAPARYLRDGWCLFVSAMCNDLSISKAREATGGEARLPLPSDDALAGAAAVLHFLRGHGAPPPAGAGG